MTGTVAKLRLDRNLNRKHLLIDFGPAASGDFLHVIGWKEQLHLPAVVALPPVGRRWSGVFLRGIGAFQTSVFRAHQSLLSLETLYISAPLLKLSSSDRPAW